jgi:hypothetical protein
MITRAVWLDPRAPHRQRRNTAPHTEAGEMRPGQNLASMRLDVEMRRQRLEARLTVADLGGPQILDLLVVLDSVDGPPAINPVVPFRDL